MLKKIGFLFVLFIAFFIILGNKKVEAAFTLTSIGTSTISSQTITTWSYASLRPTFRGTTGPSGSITITIDSVAVLVSADSAGSWVYTPAADLTVGSHTVSITDGLTTMNFTLSLTAPTTSTLPKTGGISTTIYLITGGLGMFLAGRKFLLAK